ncbi:MAG: DUF302 domain-containing protein [Pseudomonadota bacterium]
MTRISRMTATVAAAFSAAILLTAPMVQAAEDLIKLESKHDVATTLDRLEAALGKAGATVFARIDHAKGAAGVGVDMAPNQALIFGNPKIGSEPIAAAPTAGLDLPLRVVAYEADGKTWLVYRDPAVFAATHDLPADHPKVKAMTGALSKLTAKATGE